MDCDGDKEGNGDGNKGGEHVTATATKRGMAIVSRVVDDAMVTIAMVTVRRVTGEPFDLALINYRIFLCHDIFLPTLMD